MIVPIILLSLGAAMATAFIISKVTRYSPLTIVLKTVASLFFVALAIYLFVTVEGHIYFKSFTLTGLILGTLGDALLGFKYTDGKRKKYWILGGLFAFASGHIIYIVGLFLEFYVPGNILYILLPFITSSCLSALYMLISKKLGVNFGKLLPFGVFYLFCLTSMVSTAFYMALLHGFSLITPSMFFCGALCFVASDFMLTGAYFKPGQRSKPYLAIYSVFYYLAQFAIAFSLFFL